ncbi:hypothetical protein LSAT2_022292 [Lamellibrachia satsuma]|nr:hypothetical protein LSAT2_022292 [Lamellibrachia satsuma]
MPHYTDVTQRKLYLLTIGRRRKDKNKNNTLWRLYPQEPQSPFDVPLLCANLFHVHSNAAEYKIAKRHGI